MPANGIKERLSMWGEHYGSKSQSMKIKSQMHIGEDEVKDGTGFDI